jgi:hypothetical protein
LATLSVRADGIQSPFLLDRGLSRGVLHLLVMEGNPGERSHGVTVSCEAYAGFEEMIYSVADHGMAARFYYGQTDIREARRSVFLDAYVAADPLGRIPRHFLFVGTDFCYEVLSDAVSEIRAFPSKDEAYAWGPSE